MTNFCKKPLLTVVFLAGSLLLVAGCSDDNPVTPVPEPQEGDHDVVSEEDLAKWQTVLQMPDLWLPTDSGEYNFGITKLPFPGTPHQLMENFRTIYETRDVGEYLKMMHPDFLTILQDETIQDFPDVGPTLDRYEEQHIHKRMFSGLAVTDPEGDLVPGISDISFSTFYVMTPWEISPPDDVFPLTEYTLFEVEIMFDRGQSYSTLRVEGIIKFYAVYDEILHKGARVNFYRMIGQVDLTNSAGLTEGTNWGSVKALYR